jgi:sec-independent protein translocase protein TatB
MFGLSFWEISLILLVALLVLGPKRLPGLAKSIGKGLRELRRASTDLRSAIEEPLDEFRKPLRDMRDDLVGTVHNIEDRIREESGEDEDERDRPATPLGAGRREEKDAHDRAAEERRRREVEEVYASYGREAELDEDEEEERRRREVEELYASSAREDDLPDELGEPGAPALPPPDSAADDLEPPDHQSSRSEK